MKIDPTANNIRIANQLIEIVRGSGANKTLTIRNGELALYGSACGTDDDEIVLAERIDPDSFGEGWDSSDATAEQMLETLSECGE